MPARSANHPTRAEHDRPSVTKQRWLVVGLGNPEPEYAGTRHNVGADVVRLLVDRHGLTLRRHRSGVLAADTVLRPSATRVTFALPTGYMNVSGGPVQRALAFYSVPLDHLVAVHDDLDLALGSVRLKRGGGSGGHNGLRDVERRVGGRDFLRVRIGIGRPPGRQDPADYVLRRFPATLRADVDVTCARAADAVIDLIERGLEEAQNRHH